MEEIGIGTAERERGRGERERRLTGGGKRGYKRRPLPLLAALLWNSGCQCQLLGIRHAFRVIDTDSLVLGIDTMMMFSFGVF